jgi:hypothetical protein
MNINTEADRTAFPFIVAALKGQTPASDSNLFFFFKTMTCALSSLF